MAENKTRETDTDVATFLASVEPEERRVDASVLADLMRTIAGEPPKMWGPSIIGFGRHHYRYDSGREGDMPRISFSPRKAQLVIYGTGSLPNRDALLAKLGQHSHGRGCLNIKRLSDVDTGVLQTLLRNALAYSREANPD